jgi:hypothetical protein
MPVGFPDYYGGLTLPVTVAEGGTGQTSITSKAMLYGAGTSKLIETNVGTSGQYLQIDSITLIPTFEDLVVDVSAITGILPIAHGGTGTATPTLVAGTGISIAGTWPANTIAQAAPIDITCDPATGDIAIYRNSTAPTARYLQINTQAGGYSGFTSVGQGIRFNASGNSVVFEGNLLQFSGSGKIFQLNATGYNQDSSILQWRAPISAAENYVVSTQYLVSANWVMTTNSPTASFEFTPAGHFIVHTDLQLPDNPLAVAYGGTGTTTPALVAGTGISISGTWPANTIANSSNYATLADPLPVAHGGTGTATPALVAGTGISITGTWPNNTITNTQNAPSIETAATVDLTGQTAAISPTTLLTPSSAGFYRYSIEIYVNSSTGTSTADGWIVFSQSGHAFNSKPTPNVTAAAGVAIGSAVGVIYIQPSTNIQYQTSWSSGGAGDAYDIHIRLEQM